MGEGLRRWPFALAALLTLPAGQAAAHASEGGLVLLLPTDVYISAGAASVALTVVLLAVLPAQAVFRFFAPLALIRLPRVDGRHVTSWLSFLLLAMLVWIGLTGAHDPLKNPLPLFIWTVWWIGFVIVQGLIGDLWRWVSPWTGPLAAARALAGPAPLARLPARLGHAPAIASFLGFVAFLLADPAPADPSRLALFVTAYWTATFVLALVFGPRWMRRGEAFTLLLTSYATVAIFGRRQGRLSLGAPGWRIATRRAPPLCVGVFMLLMLGGGSFDGLNETFWWLSVIGVNPLEFPGRSAVIPQNLTGLLLAQAGLIAAFAATVWLGLRLNRSDMALAEAFRIFAPSILPIALGYHVAHYLTSLLVDGQYALLAATDPLTTGADLLGLGQVYVTTGFFNTPDSVRVIFLTQAGAVVIGHILAVMLAHGVAIRHFGSTRRAALSQAPLAAFMVVYTLFGLWLLASPRGL